MTPGIDRMLTDSLGKHGHAAQLIHREVLIRDEVSSSKLWTSGEACETCRKHFRRDGKFPKLLRGGREFVPETIGSTMQHWNGNESQIEILRRRRDRTDWHRGLD